MDMTEKTLSQEYHFRGKIVNMRVDQIELPNGRHSIREVCEHVGGVGVLPIDNNGNVILVRQYRYPYACLMLELPAGKLDHGPEDHRACGERELMEETGYSAKSLTYVGTMAPSCGFLTEIVHLYVAKDLVAGACHPDEDEFVETVRYPIAQVEQMIAAGEITDAKTITAMYRARLLGLL